MSGGQRLDGLVLVDKPAGPTSHDVVAQIRRAAGQRQVGHTGTLDPMASGLLLLVLGRATRLARFLPQSPKCYEGTFRLGRTTTTDDVTGQELTRHDAPLPAPGAVSRAVAELLGRSSQVPPAVSARKLGGRRLYALARRGVAVEVPPREIEVRRFVVRREDRERYAFEADVSAGTYIRALVRDVGARLGCGGVLESLRRTAIGPLRVEEALRPTQERDALVARLVEMEAMPLVPPPLRLLDASAEQRFVHGDAVDAGTQPAPGLYRVLAASGRLLGVAESRDGLLRPKVVLEGR